MEQIDMFELDLDETQQLFKKFNLVPECGEYYVVCAKACKYQDGATVNNVRVNGVLIKYDADEIALGNTWIEDGALEAGLEQGGHYENLVLFSHKLIQKIELAPTFEFEVGLVYRAEIYQKNPVTGRPTTWISCYYHGTTHSGKIMLVTVAKPSEIMILSRRDIKVFSPLALDEVKTLLSQEYSRVE